MVERFRESEITCPYCGNAFTDSWEYGYDNDGDSGIEECEKCNKKFQVLVHRDVSFSSVGRCEENNTEHKWERYASGKRCAICEEIEFDKTEAKI